MDSTPGNWPNERRGLLDDLRDCVMSGALKRRFTGLFRRRGFMRVGLGKGQCALLTGAGSLRVQCLSGRAWITGPAHGLDAFLEQGQSLDMAARGGVCVSAVDDSAELRFAWH